MSTITVTTPIDYLNEGVQAHLLATYNAERITTDVDTYKLTYTGLISDKVVGQLMDESEYDDTVQVVFE